MKKQLLCVLLLLAGRFLMAQTTIVQWDFNTTSSFSVIANGMVPPPTLGTGSMSLLGNVTASSIGGFTNVDRGTPARSLSTTSYPSVNSSPLSAGIYVVVNTTGYDGIHFTYYTEHTGTAANKTIVQYLDATGWQTIDTYTASSTSGTSNPVLRDVNLSLVTSINNRDSVKLRIVTDFANGTSYAPTNINSSGYAPSGAIHFDLVTVTGRPLSCGSLATQQATGLRLLKTDSTSAQLTLNRGNGKGCIVLCRANGVPSTTPSNNINYSASAVYGNGDTIGNAFVVYNSQTNNPSTQYFEITGLTAGTQYYITAYEYSSIGYCYLSPALTGNFYCNSTILYPGDLQFVGFDSDAGSNGTVNGNDAFALTNFKDLNPGTSFQIVNSCYEAGTAANVRTQRWYASANGNGIYGDMEYITLLYTGANPLPKGSIISFDFLPPGTNIKVDNNPSTAFILTSNVATTSSMLSSNPEQFFLTQGKFTSFLTPNVSQYSLLDGHVLHGISYKNAWVPLGQACTATRESRIPPDIKCLNLSFALDDYAFYKATTPPLHSGSQGQLLGSINNASNWTNAGSSNSTNNISSIYGTRFTITSAPITTNWVGNASSAGTNWFNCSNWENLYVPDSTANVSVATTIPAAIDLSNALSAEYSNLASVRNLSIANTVMLNGTSADKLTVYDSLSIGSTGILSTSGATDTVTVRGSVKSDNVTGLQLNSNSWLSLQGNRQLQPINVSLPGTLPVGVAALSLNNPPGININNGGFESLQKLDLANGILSPATPAGFHYMAAGCTISSPTNLYNETNKGWEKSYIDGKVFIRTNAATDYFAPLGSKQKGTFSPMIIRPQTGGAVYEASYVGMSHPNVGPADVNDPPIKKVSNQEYWTLVSNPNNAAANISLYYTPASFVGGPQGTDPQALTDLRIVQYWDSGVNSPQKWRFPTVPVSFSSGPNVQYGKITMSPGLYVTSLRELDKNFTLGSAAGINTLPIQIITWVAQLQAAHTRLIWQVQQEAGTTFYTVEKSLDGKTFQPIRTVYATGLTAYICFDETPANGWNYYRLKITDVSGKTGYTTIEKVWLKPTAAFAVFPNPASDKVFISLPSATQAIICLYAPDGKKCLEQAVATLFTQLSIKGLSTGWYLLEYWDGKNRLTQKLLIK